MNFFIAIIVEPALIGLVIIVQPARANNNLDTFHIHTTALYYIPDLKVHYI